MKKLSVFHWKRAADQNWRWRKGKMNDWSDKWSNLCAPVRKIIKAWIYSKDKKHWAEIVRHQSWRLLEFLCAIPLRCLRVLTKKTFRLSYSMFVSEYFSSSLYYLLYSESTCLLLPNHQWFKKLHYLDHS